jgi:hypothetical protein
MFCGRCCVTEPRSRLALRLDIFIEILLCGWAHKVGEGHAQGSSGTPKGTG